MRRFARARRAAAGAAAAVLLLPGPAAPAARGPRLLLVSESPIVVRGAFFRPYERIVVRLAEPGRRWVRRARAGSRGGFVVRWENARVHVCPAPPALTATGRRSSLVVGVVPPRECAAP